MANCLILYGSRARGGARPDSDTDLILAMESSDLENPTEHNGVSIHRYPKAWLSAQARKGSLFLYHVVVEGFALDDPDNFLARLREDFRAKVTYRNEVDVALLVLKMLIEQDWQGNEEARRRFFWAVRTIYIGTSATQKTPRFSSGALEAVSGIEGLAVMIDKRSNESFSECRALGLKILKEFSSHFDQALGGVQLRDRLVGLGGIARDSVRVLEENEAIEASGIRLYL